MSELTGHRELNATAFGEREVGQTFQLTVGLRIDVEVAQTTLLLEVALASVGLIVLEAIRGGDYLRPYGDQHLLIEGYAEVLSRHLCHLTWGMQQNLFGQEIVMLSFGKYIFNGYLL